MYEKLKNHTMKDAVKSVESFGEVAGSKNKPVGPMDDTNTNPIDTIIILKMI